MSKLRIRFAWTSGNRSWPSTGAVAGLTLLFLSGCSSLGLETEPIARTPVEASSIAHPEGYVRGRQHLAAGRFGLALAELRRALRRDPGSVATLNAMAVSYDLLGRFDLARSHYERALAYEPQSAQTLNNFGRSLLRQGRPDLALGYFERAAELGEDVPVVQANLELARSLTASARTAADGPARPGLARRTVWVERSTSRTQTLVTSGPDAASTVDRSMVHVAAAEVRPALGIAIPHEFTVEVSNGAGRRHMAARFRSFLGTHGLRTARLTNASHFRFEQSVIFYRPGFEAAARRLASLLPSGVPIESIGHQPVDIRLRLGGDLLDFDTDVLTQAVAS